MRVAVRHLKFAAVASLLALSTLAHAQSSTNTVTYQGVLTQSGAPVADGMYTLTFKIYDAATGGSVVETIAVPGVATSQGKFNALVPVAPSSFSGADRWWSVTFNGVELPRQKVTATPYAVRASGLAGAVAVFEGTSLALDFLDSTDPTHATGGKWSLQPGAFQPGYFGIVRYEGSAQPTSSFVVSRTGNVGIGTPDPQSTLDCAGHALFRRGLEVKRINGDYALAVDRDTGQTSVRVLTITGADVAEKFDIAPTGTELKPVPGMVVSIDPANPGKLAVSTTAYDRKVAGVISGANGLDAGVILGKGNANPLIDGEHPVAMTGRVWVFADQSAGEIVPGDRLTTSGVKAGYAMKVIDETQAPGSVIGKAMTGVDPATGMVLVLVNLQ